MVSAATITVFQENSRRQNVGEEGWVSSGTKIGRMCSIGGVGEQFASSDLADETRNGFERKL